MLPLIFHQIPVDGFQCGALATSPSCQTDALQAQPEKPRRKGLKRALPGLHQLRQPFSLIQQRDLHQLAEACPAGIHPYGQTTADTLPVHNQPTPLYICQGHHGIGDFNQLLFFHLQAPSKPESFQLRRSRQCPPCAFASFHPAASPAITGRFSSIRAAGHLPLQLSQSRWHHHVTIWLRLPVSTTVLPAKAVGISSALITTGAGQ